MKKEIEIVKAYLIETFINDNQNTIIESYYDSPYCEDYISKVWNKNNEVFYVDNENMYLYTETDFFYKYILKEENYLLHLYDEFIESNEEFEKNIDFDKNGQYMIPLITKFGVLYYYSNKEYDFKYTLLDSDKNFFTNIYETEIEDIIKCNTINEFIDLIGDYVCYADDLNDILEIINDKITENNINYGCDDELMTMEDLKDNDYLNKIGKTYVFFMESI